MAKELDGNSDKNEELITSDTEQNSDNDVEHPKVSTPARDQRNKRVRNNIKFGELSSIKCIKDNHDASSEGEHSEEIIKEVKKPKLGERSESHEGNIIAEDKTNNPEEHEEGKVGEKDHNEELIEKDKILQDLLDMHEDVPLEDPGPTNEEREEGVAEATL